MGCHCPTPSPCPGSGQTFPYVGVQQGFRAEKQQHPKGPLDVTGPNCCLAQTWGFVLFVVRMSQFSSEKVMNGSKQHVCRLFGFFSSLARDFLLLKHWVFEQGCCVSWWGWLVPRYLWDCSSNPLNGLQVKMGDDALFKSKFFLNLKISTVIDV